MKTLIGPAPNQSPPLRYSQLCKLAILELKRVSKSKQSARFLEIGSWTGASSAVLSLVGDRFLNFNLLKNFELVCVDPLIPYLKEKNSHYLEMQAALADNQVLDFFTRNLTQFANVDLVQFKQLSSKRFYEINEEVFDFIYIDGAHDYHSVLVDLINSQKIVVQNGILCGDDLEYLVPPSRLLHHIALARKSDYVFGYHPGVTQAFGEVFPNIKSVNKSGFYSLVKNGQEFKSKLVDENAKFIPYWIPLKDSIFLVESKPEEYFNLILHDQGIFKVPFSTGEVTYQDFLKAPSKLSKRIEFYSNREDYFKTQIDELINLKM